MPKTPDEIKKGLVEAIEECAWVVEGGDAHDLQDACEMAHASMADALALIQQLEGCLDKEGEQNRLLLDKNKQLEERNKSLRENNDNLLALDGELHRDMLEQRERADRLEAERAELLDLCEQFGQCVICEHTDKGTNESPCCDCWYCNGDATGSRWQWRGVQKEE